MAQRKEEFSEREVAQLTLQLDETITRMRRGASARHVAQGILLLPIKPTRTELAVLTALAQTYGPVILRHDPFGLVLDCIATPCWTSFGDASRRRIGAPGENHDAAADRRV